MNSSTITKVAFGGQGIFKEQNTGEQSRGGMVVFIPFTVTGDHIAYRVVKRYKNHSLGKLERILEPSSERVEARCPYFGRCGGCQIQHIQYPLQLELKRQWIEDALMRIGEVREPKVPAIFPVKQRWEYRRKISLTLSPQSGCYQAGYIAVDGKSLLSVSECPIFCPQNDTILSLIQASAKKLVPRSGKKGKVSLLKTIPGKYLLHFHFDLLPVNIEDVCLDLHQSHPELMGIIASSRSRTMQWGESTVEQQIEGITVYYSSTAFIQAHPDQSAKIYQLVVEQLKSLSTGILLDLYCGIGITSVLIAKQGWKVIGVELNREAVALANENAKHNQVAKEAQFIQGDVAKLLPELIKRYRPSALLLNPPREGISTDVVYALLNDPVEKLFYISCMPPTLARDVKALEKQYEILQIEGFDMFPQTTHVETMLILKRKGKS